MASSSRSSDSPKPRRRPPATTPETRESQMIALATDVAEQQLRAGRASSQVITHYLKLATEREKLERAKLQGENELLKAKVENLASQSRSEGLYDKALAAFRSYQGRRGDDEYDEEL